MANVAVRRSSNDLLFIFFVLLGLIFTIQQLIIIQHFGNNGTLDITSADLKKRFVSFKKSIPSSPREHDAQIQHAEIGVDQIIPSDENAYLTMYGSHRVKDSIEQLPKWLRDYVEWHRQQKQNPTDDTKYLVLTCLTNDKQCGGISDRLRPLPFFLLFASLVPRVLCIHWVKPLPLESFLQPPEGGMDWRCPEEVTSLFDPSLEMGQQKVIKPYLADRCGRRESTISCVESKIQKMRKDNGKYRGARLVSNDVSSINKVLNLFQSHTYREQARSIEKWDFVDLNGAIFRTLFEPVPPLAKMVNETMSNLHLVENSYTSVHTRCRYPVYPVAKNDGVQVDKEGGLKFEGKTKDQLIEIMENAVNCAHQLAPDLPIYFASDHDDATRYMISNDIAVDPPSAGGTTSSSSLSSALSTKVVRPMGVDRKEEPLHMGNEKYDGEKKASDYYSVFEDLLIIGGSRCVSHGIGSFGSFGASLIQPPPISSSSSSSSSSSTAYQCRSIHRKFTGGLVKCPNDRGMKKMMPIKEGELLFGEKPGAEGTIQWID